MVLYGKSRQKFIDNMKVMGMDDKLPIAYMLMEQIQNMGKIFTLSGDIAPVVEFLEATIVDQFFNQDGYWHDLTRVLKDCVICPSYNDCMNYYVKKKKFLPTCKIRPINILLDNLTAARKQYFAIKKFRLLMKYIGKMGLMPTRFVYDHVNYDESLDVDEGEVIEEADEIESE